MPSAIVREFIGTAGDTATFRSKLREQNQTLGYSHRGDDGPLQLRADSVRRCHGDVDDQLRSGAGGGGESPVVGVVADTPGETEVGAVAVRAVRRQD